MASTSRELFEAIEADDAERVRALLAEDPSLAGSRDDEGVSALMRARYRFDKGVIEAVAEAAPPLDVCEAAAFGDLDRLTELLMFDPALVTAYSADGFTALHLAAFFGRPDAARFLLDRGADADAAGRGWMTGTPLHSAASSRQPEIVAILLEAGADPAARQSHGWTALHSAARNGDLASVEALLAAGADASATNDDGASVRDLAVEGGDEAVLAAIDRALGPGSPS
jgi:ankyrin repeat protein